MIKGYFYSSFFTLHFEKKFGELYKRTLAKIQVWRQFDDQTLIQQKVFICELMNLKFLEIDALLVVDIKDRPHPKLKWHPFKSIKIKPLGAFSFVPYGVLHIKYIRAFIHVNIEELGISQFLNLYTNHIVGEDLCIKPEFKTLEEKFTQILKFPVFKENEWVWYILSKVHAKIM